MATGHLRSLQLEPIAIMTSAASPSLVSYQAATEAFRQGTDTPRDFLERAIDKIDALEPTLRAFTALALPRSRIAADAATARWRAGKPLSRIDGMPVGIKDVIETFDMPTGLGSPTTDGYRPMRDAATVFALREAGAGVLGKTKTTEFASSFPADTRHPLDPRRTPGGSSSGSAAAVGAGILPVALGTQVIGSILRPASFCGAVGWKPTFGAINRGGSHDFQSQSCIGLIGASLADVWCTAHEMVQRAGGDPGQMGLVGNAELAAPAKPVRLFMLELPGWDKATQEARQGLDALVSACSAAGVQIVTNRNNADLAAFEKSLQGVRELGRDITGYESRWPLKSVAYRDRLGLSPNILSRIADSDALGLDGYRALLKQRAAVREAFGKLAPQADAFITLTAIGAAPIGLHQTGDSNFTVPASILGAPALSVPLLQDEGLPLGVQLIAAQHQDEKLFALAGWLLKL
jgi:Asp-tRNA(Asn)/Glu-tRNA(Gln) amidotransferase A subunit family amidase